MGNASTFKAGTTVRIVTDPGRVGVVLEKLRNLGDEIYQQVQFPDGPQFLRPSQLEEIAAESEDPLDLLSDGKFGRVRDLRGLLTHIRLSGRLANLIYSMETTNTDFYAYQFKPVLNFLDSPSGGLLVADEVGLGKTIEAGLIWTELRSRFDSRRLLIVCPAVLREKWRLELQYRFGIDAEIVNAEEAARRLADVQNGRRHEIHLIGSMQGLAPRRGWHDEEDRKDGRSKLARLISSAQYDEPLFDLVIIDEAHYMRNPETMSAALGRLLRGVTEHVLLLSATPIHLRNRDLYQLLNLVDEDTFNEPRVFDEILRANEPLLQARELVLKGSGNDGELKSLVSEAGQHPFLANSRQLADIRQSLTTDNLADPGTKARLANRLERLNLLGHAVTRTRKREVTEWRVVREAVAETVEMDPAELHFYNTVTGLVREYCARRDAHEGFLLVTPQRQVASSMAAALRDWQQRAELRMEELEDYVEEFDEIPDQPGPLVGELLRNAENLGDLDRLYACDTKYRRLVEMLSSYFAEHSKEKIILFSTFKATLRYLHERLSRDGVDSMILMGGMREDKHDVIREFQAKKASCVLLASEVASEGIDLQFARVLINYDLPWNPMKVEQRIGRIDRLGQKSPKITIWNMMYGDTIDARIYSRLFNRLGVFESALGGLEAVLGDEIRKLTMDLMRGNVTPEQEEERIEQTATAMASLRKMEADLEDQADNLVAHGDYILRQVRAAREMNRWITGEDLCAYVLDFFNKYYPGCEFYQRRSDELRFDIRLTEPARFDLERFVNRYRLQGKSRLPSSSSAAVQCEFRNRVSSVTSGRLEIISQFHPLVRFVGFSVREKGERYYPCVSCKLQRVLAGEFDTGDYMFAVDHWSLTGLRVIEKINYAVAKVGGASELLPSDKGEMLITHAAIHGSDWLSADRAMDLGNARAVVERCLTQSILDYERFVTDTMNENNDRADLQIASLERHSSRQLQMLNEVLRGHRQKGRDALVKATEGRVTKLKERVSWKKREIERNREIAHSRNDICVGIVRIE
jgi:superfamily II DNA or RNA helicase